MKEKWERTPLISRILGAKRWRRWVGGGCDECGYVKLYAYSNSRSAPIEAESK